MKKNRKESGGKLLGVLLALAMIVGLFPGMSLTAYAANNANNLTIYIMDMLENIVEFFFVAERDGDFLAYNLGIIA